jgi:hypothetical protein
MAAWWRYSDEETRYAIGERPSRRPEDKLPENPNPWGADGGVAPRRLITNLLAPHANGDLDMAYMRKLQLKAAEQYSIAVVSHFEDARNLVANLSRGQDHARSSHQLFAIHENLEAMHDAFSDVLYAARLELARRAIEPFPDLTRFRKQHAFLLGDESIPALLGA